LSLKRREAVRFYLKLAWRNIFRNRRRTFLTGLIIGIGLASMIFVDASMLGMKANMVSSGTSSFLGQAEIHREGFQRSQDASLTIARSPQVIAALREDAHVAAFTERVLATGTVSSPADIASVAILGIAPRTERRLSTVDDSMLGGAYLEGTEGTGALIGARLAERLGVAVGDRLVVAVAKAGTGELSQDLFRISGIYRMHIEAMDSSVVLIPIARAQRMLGIGEGIHEIAIDFRDPQYATRGQQEFARDYSRFGNVAQTWPQLMPEVKYILDMLNISIAVTVIIVFAMIIFGIVNTLFMSLHERVFEFGVLRAVGTRPGRLRNLIVFEAGSLAVYAVLLGSILGAVITLIGSLVGMDLTGVDLGGTTFTGRIYAVFSVRQFTLYPLLVFAFTLLVSLYPARHAGRMSIARALQRSL
jgi:ABC-type lipoprotein release transport system permease subunit